jgi:hypothetical protein
MRPSCSSIIGHGTLKLFDTPCYASLDRFTSYVRFSVYVDGVAPDLLRDFKDLRKIWRFFRCVRQIVILLRSNSGFAQPLD